MAYLGGNSRSTCPAALLHGPGGVARRVTHGNSWPRTETKQKSGSRDHDSAGATPTVVETGGADASRGPRAAPRPAPGAPWTGAEAPGSGAAPSPRPSYDSDLHRGSIRLDLSPPPPTAPLRDGRGLRRGQHSAVAADKQTQAPPSRAGAAATHRARQCRAVRGRRACAESGSGAAGEWGGSVDLNRIERWQRGTGKVGQARREVGRPSPHERAGASTGTWRLDHPGADV
jgi:hypothetical protein